MQQDFLTVNRDKIVFELVEEEIGSPRCSRTERAETAASSGKDLPMAT